MRSKGMACKQQTSVLVVSSNNAMSSSSTLSVRHEKCEALKKFLLCSVKQGKVKIFALNILCILHAFRARMRTWRQSMKRREKLWSSQLPVKALKHLKLTPHLLSFSHCCLSLSRGRRRNQVLNHNFHSLNITNFTTAAAEYRMS